MLAEINKDFYCTRYRDPGKKCNEPFDCIHGIQNPDYYCCFMKRKHPTPEQFKQEYGFDYPDDGAVYIYDPAAPEKGYELYYYSYAKTNFEFLWDSKAVIICACTPWGKPPDDWRSE